MVFIYILKCKNNKYYVGKTTNPSLRIESHYFSFGSLWTKRYKPIKTKRIIPNCDVYDEDKYTIMTMAKYGVDNVRGGSFIGIFLSTHEKNLVTRMINNANDNCFNCGSFDHFTNKCASGTFPKLLKRLNNEIIRQCRLKDTNDDNKINPDDYISILYKADIVIFNGIDKSNLKQIVDFENKKLDYYDCTYKLLETLRKA